MGISYWGPVLPPGMTWDALNQRLGVGISTPTSKLHVIGTGLFENPASTGNGSRVGGNGTTTAPNYAFSLETNTGIFRAEAYTISFCVAGSEVGRIFSDRFLLGTTSGDASAKMQIVSTTRGFLPPKMTTAQKNAIASPVSGLIVFDTTLNKLCVYGAAAWETITSS